MEIIGFLPFTRSVNTSSNEKITEKTKIFPNSESKSLYFFLTHSEILIKIITSEKVIISNGLACSILSTNLTKMVHNDIRNLSWFIKVHLGIAFVDLNMLKPRQNDYFYHVLRSGLHFPDRS